MRLLHWNVNGVRAVDRKEVRPDCSFAQFIAPYDVVALNETKLSVSAQFPAGAARAFPHAFHAVSTRRKGYSGVSVLCKERPRAQLVPPFADDEGRVIALEFDRFVLVAVYVPNSGAALARLRHRTEVWDARFRCMCRNLADWKPLLVLGDMNVAPCDSDVHDPQRCSRLAGFTPAERSSFRKLTAETPLFDLWRLRAEDNGAAAAPQAAYTFFDYRSRARLSNKGWRIDLALASPRLLSVCDLDTRILSDVLGSDHVPLEVEAAF